MFFEDVFEAGELSFFADLDGEDKCTFFCLKHDGLGRLHPPSIVLNDELLQRGEPGPPPATHVR